MALVNRENWTRMDAARWRTLGVVARVALGQEEILVVRDFPDSVRPADTTR